MYDPSFSLHFYRRRVSWIIITCAALCDSNSKSIFGLTGCNEENSCAVYYIYIHVMSPRVRGYTIELSSHPIKSLSLVGKAVSPAHSLFGIIIRIRLR